MQCISDSHVRWLHRKKLPLDLIFTLAFAITNTHVLNLIHIWVRFPTSFNCAALVSSFTLYGLSSCVQYPWLLNDVCVAPWSWRLNILSNCVWDIWLKMDFWWLWTRQNQSNTVLVSMPRASWWQKDWWKRCLLTALPSTTERLWHMVETVQLAYLAGTNNNAANAVWEPERVRKRGELVRERLISSAISQIAHS